MARVILGMTISLDGFVQDSQGSVASLFSDLNELRGTALMRDAIRDTGAVVMGRRTFGMAADPDSYAEHYEFQTPIFVVTHHAPQQHPKENEQLKFSFVADGVESAIRQARIAAQDKDVCIVGGASTAQQALRGNLVDELQVDIMPVLLHSGLRFLEHLEGEPRRFERIAVTKLPGGRTHLRFRVR